MLVYQCNTKLNFVVLWNRIQLWSIRNFQSRAMVEFLSIDYPILPYLLALLSGALGHVRDQTGSGRRDALGHALGAGGRRRGGRGSGRRRRRRSRSGRSVGELLAWIINYESLFLLFFCNRKLYRNIFAVPSVLKYFLSLGKSKAVTPVKL